MLRGLIFTAIYYLISALYVLTALPLLLLPWRQPMAWWIRHYTKTLNFALRWICGIRREIRGKDNLPDGPYLIAAKHASWGDGFMLYPEIEEIGFVTGDHLERFPLVGGILKKLGAIVINTCGGGEKKAASLTAGLSRLKGTNRRILIHPEGHLAPAGYHFRYKPGIWHMQQVLNVPIVPVATNLNCFWQQEEIQKTPGTAVLEFLDPIPPGGSKDETMARLTQVIETRCAELIAEATGQPSEPTRLLPDPNKGEIAAIPAHAEREKMVNVS